MRRLPRVVRRATIPSGMPGVPRISVGYLFDRILPRDLWMHRVDITRATGRPMVVGDHDASIVDDVLAELVDGWTGPPVRIELSGPAGGAWTAGAGAPVATVAGEPVDVLRSLAGRNPAPSLSVVTGDPSVVAAVTAARVVF
jgi:hypothetical protein